MLVFSSNCWEDCVPSVHFHKITSSEHESLPESILHHVAGHVSLTLVQFIYNLYTIPTAQPCTGRSVIFKRFPSFTSTAAPAPAILRYYNKK